MNIIPILPLLISQTNPDFGSYALNYGVAGLMLLWFMLRNEARMKAMETAITRNTRANIIMLLEIKRTSEEGKRQANEVLDEITADEKRKHD